MKKITIKEFQALPNNDETKINMIKQKPELIFRLSNADKKKTNNNDIRNLIMIALKANPSLIDKFKDFGIQVDIMMINFVKNQNAQKIGIISRKEILQNLVKDINYINEIPSEVLTGYMYNSCVRVLKKLIKSDFKNFEKLPATLQMRYALIEAYALANSDNIYKLSNEQLMKNKGKVLFKLICQDTENLNKVSPILLKQSLVRKALKIDGAIYEDLDEEFKNNEYNKYLAAKNLILTGRKKLCKKLFNETELEYINSKLLRVKNSNVKAIGNLKLKLKTKQNETRKINSYLEKEQALTK